MKNTLTMNFTYNYYLNPSRHTNAKIKSILPAFSKGGVCTSTFYSHIEIVGVSGEPVNVIWRVYLIIIYIDSI